GIAAHAQVERAAAERTPVRAAQLRQLRLAERRAKIFVVERAFFENQLAARAADREPALSAPCAARVAQLGGESKAVVLAALRERPQLGERAGQLGAREPDLAAIESGGEIFQARRLQELGRQKSARDRDRQKRRRHAQRYARVGGLEAGERAARGELDAVRVHFEPLEADELRVPIGDHIQASVSESRGGRKEIRQLRFDPGEMDFARDARAALGGALQVQPILQIAARRILRGRPPSDVPEKRRGRSGAGDVGVDARALGVQIFVGEKRRALERHVRLPPAAADDGLEIEIDPGSGGNIGLERLQRLAQPFAAQAMQRQMQRLKARLDRLSSGRAVGEKNLAAVDAKLAEIEREAALLAVERQIRDQIHPGNFAVLVADDLGPRPVKMDGVENQPALKQRQQRDADQDFRRGNDGHIAVAALEREILERNAENAADLDFGRADLEFEAAARLELADEIAPELAHLD